MLSILKARLGGNLGGTQRSGGYKVFACLNAVIVDSFKNISTCIFLKQPLKIRFVDLCCKSNIVRGDIFCIIVSDKNQCFFNIGDAQIVHLVRGKALSYLNKEFVNHYATEQRGL